MRERGLAQNREGLATSTFGWTWCWLCFFFFLCRHRTDLGEGEERRNVGPGSWQRCSVLASVEKVVSKRLLALVLAHIKWWLWKSATELHYKGTLESTRTQALDILRRE